MQLEIADDCNKGWKALAGEIGFKEYQFILCLEKRALAHKRSPAGMVLDMFFKDKHPGTETLKRLSNYLFKIDSYAAKQIVDKEINVMEGKMPQHAKVQTHASNNSYLGMEAVISNDSELNGAAVAIPFTDDEKLRTEGLPCGKKGSLRTNLLRKKWSSIQHKVEKMGKMTRKFSEQGGNKEHPAGQSNPAFEDGQPDETTETRNQSLDKPKFSEVEIPGECYEMVK